MSTQRSRYAGPTPDAEQDRPWTTYRDGHADYRGRGACEVAELGLHSLAFDLDLHQDEPLHRHEFDWSASAISGTVASLTSMGRDRCWSRVPP